MSLFDWGWSATLAAALADGETPCRVIASHSNLARVVTDTGESIAPTASWRPVTGDWAVLEGGRIKRLLPRRTVISRKRAGLATEEQVLAANVDVVFVVSGLDGDFNPRRLERYLVLALESGAEPVFVLNKADLCPDLGASIAAARAVAAGHPVIVASALDGTGVEAMRAELRPGITGTMLGSSGVGKSTLLNALTGGESQATGPVREHDSRGRHTTTHRELFLLPGGGLLLDQPGLREIQPWAEADSVDAAFPEIGLAAAACRFRDCRHQGEPGCAVAGSVDEERLASYTKLARERDALAVKRRDRDGSLRLRQFQKLHDKRR